MYASAGWGSGSAFADHGKISALKLSISYKTYQERITQVGQSWHAELFSEMQQITY